MATLIRDQVRTAGLFRDTTNCSTPGIFAQEHILPKYYALAFFCLLVADKSWAITPGSDPNISIMLQHSWQISTGPRTPYPKRVLLFLDFQIPQLFKTLEICFCSLAHKNDRTQKP
jgi:hypothetical protein